jgi:hypothetical protein
MPTPGSWSQAGLTILRVPAARIRSPRRMGLESADDPAESDCIRCTVMPRPRPHGGRSRVCKSQPSWGHLADHHGIAAGHDDHGQWTAGGAGPTRDPGGNLNAGRRPPAPASHVSLTVSHGGRASRRPSSKSSSQSLTQLHELLSSLTRKPVDRRAAGGLRAPWPP